MRRTLWPWYGAACMCMYYYIGLIHHKLYIPCANIIIIITETLLSDYIIILIIFRSFPPVLPVRVLSG
jgi:hypothetical protein